MQKTILLGSVDYNQTGKSNCPVDFEVSWDGKRFSATATIWRGANRREALVCGQCLEEAAAHLPENQLAQRILAVWRDWHLNDMRAGSPAQQAWLKANPVEAVYPESHYEKACKALAEVGLNPDPGHLHNGKPYAYGSAWLTEEIPAETVSEIESWFTE
jgi:hypothetical protein